MAVTLHLFLPSPTFELTHSLICVAIEDLNMLFQPVIITINVPFKKNRSSKHVMAMIFGKKLALEAVK